MPGVSYDDCYGEMSCDESDASRESEEGLPGEVQDRGVFFCFESMNFDQRTNIATFTFSFCGEQKFVARTHMPKMRLARIPGQEAPDLSCALFHVGLTILPWYWMGFAVKRVVIAAGFLSCEQVAFWEDFYRKVLAEFFFLNALGPERHMVLEVTASAGLNDSVVVPAAGDASSLSAAREDEEVLCCLGGGKDSLVVFELLRRFGRKPRWLYVGDGVDEYRSHPRLKAIVEASEAPALVTAHELSDPKWNKAKIRTLHAEGHPWAALVATTAAAVALAGGLGVIAVGNERSAAIGNGVVAPGGLEVNHQYDKSLGWEVALREYMQRYICPTLLYFSPLQPLWELQISRAFCVQAETSRYHRLFMSCNEAPQLEWCGVCAKCCFIYALMAAWLEPERVAAIFGSAAADEEEATGDPRRRPKGGRREAERAAGATRQTGRSLDLLDKPELVPMFASLLGIYLDGVGKHKPLDCVGTEAEARLALRLAVRRRRRATGGLPHVLAVLQEHILGGSEGQEGQACAAAALEMLREWDDAAWLPSWLPPRGLGWFLDVNGRDLLHGDVEL